MIEAKETLIDYYIRKQQDLTAVESFSKKYDNGKLEQLHSKYRELIPANLPGKGEQFAFEIDLDKCTGCKACITGCHNENGLEEDEIWRTVGLIQGGDGIDSTMQHITSACHHCVEPACMHGCPTLAYVKDPETGIVKHLEDQCFGCQYCILKCPYDVPKYSKEKGIVHKCDMCQSRLKENEAPACVKSCPNEAISITIVNKEEVSSNPQEYVNISDLSDPTITKPTTKYKTGREFPKNMISLDYFSVKPEHYHLPLVIMLVLTQLSVGTFLSGFLIKYFATGVIRDSIIIYNLPVALFIAVIALGASLFHLGRPHLAFRAVLGFRTSWLSREIIVFGLFAGLAGLYSVTPWLNTVLSSVKDSFLENLLETGISILNAVADNILAALVCITGLLGVYCSVKVYKDTKRPFWNTKITNAKFFLTTLILGFTTVLITSVIIAYASNNISLKNLMFSFGHTYLVTIIVFAVIKLFIDSYILISLRDKEITIKKKSALLLTRQLKDYLIMRYFTGIAGGIIIPVALIALTGYYSEFTIVVFSCMILVFNLSGEFLERFLFFAAVVPLKMPGSRID